MALLFSNAPRSAHKIFVILAFLTYVPILLSADEGKSNTKKPVSTAEKKYEDKKNDEKKSDENDFKFGLGIDAGISSNIYVPSHPDFSSSVDGSLTSSVSKKSFGSISGNFGIAKEATGEQEWDYSDLSFTASPKSYAFMLPGRSDTMPNPENDPDAKYQADVYFRPSLSVYFPTSKGSRQIRSTLFQTSLGLPLRFTGDIMGAPEFSTVVSTSLTKTFHEYDVDVYGNSNISFSTSIGLSIQYHYLSWFNAQISGSRKFGFTYHSNIVHGFSHTEAIGFIPHERISLSIAHSNGGNILKANGYDSNLSLYSEQGSQLNLSVGFELL